METIVPAIEILAAVTGILYVVLEILQKNSMWVVGIITGLACAFEFAICQIWASMGLNLYYVVMSVIGLIQWRKDGAQVAEGAVHLNILPKRTALWSAALFVSGGLALIWVLRITGDRAPVLDGVSSMLSVIATWWLAQSYLPQWLLWVVADVLTTVLCLTTGQYYMAAMYLAYAGSAVYGYFHWKNHGEYVYLKD